MKTLYEPSNALEAQMLHDLLQQEGISTRVNGAYLQGGVGELPASGLIRLVVEDADYDRGREVVQRWEATEVPDSAPAPARAPANGFRALLAGALIGVVGSYLYFHAPLNNDGIDHNHDGVLDQIWRYSPSGTFLGSKVDRNLDGKIDYVDTAGVQGYSVSAESDDDFDGVFETRHRFRAGNYEVSETDTDGDTLPNLKTHFTHGVLTSFEYINPHTGWPVRVEHYRLGAITTAEVDTDEDGKLDKRYTYSNLAKITREEAIEQKR